MSSIVELYCYIISVQYLADIEEHLGVTIDQVDTSLKVTANEFDGKVTYGQKRSNTGMLAPVMETRPKC